MSLSVTSRPTTAAGTGGVNGEFTWVAIAGDYPVLFHLTRKDNTTALIRDNGGFVEIELAAFDWRSFYPDGTNLYFSTTLDVSTKFGAVTSSTFSGGNTYLVLDVPWPSGASSDTGANYVNFADQIYPVVVDWTDPLGNSLLGTTLNMKPKSDGTLKVDASILATLFTNETYHTIPAGPDNFDTDQTNVIAFELKATFPGVFGGGDLTLNDNRTFYGINAALQIQDAATYGNMEGYIAANIASTSIKFLTPYRNTRWWNGYEQNLAFIYQDDTAGVSLGLRSEYFNSAGVSQGSRNTSISETDLADGIGYVKPYRYSGSVDDLTGGYFDVWLDEATTGQITEKIRFYVDNCNHENPFYIAWLNELGGNSYWLFDVKQEYSGELSRTTYNPAIDDIATTTATKRRKRAQRSQFVTLIADKLSEDEFNHLQTILDAPRVWWYKDGTASSRVEIVATGGSTIEYNNEPGLYSWEWTFELPQKFLQSN